MRWNPSFCERREGRDRQAARTQGRDNVTESPGLKPMTRRAIQSCSERPETCRLHNSTWPSVATGVNLQDLLPQVICQPSTLGAHSSMAAACSQGVGIGALARLGFPDGWTPQTAEPVDRLRGQVDAQSQRPCQSGQSGSASQPLSMTAPCHQADPRLRSGAAEWLRSGQVRVSDDQRQHLPRFTQARNVIGPFSPLRPRQRLS